MRFKRIYIEITNTCNLHCQFCIQNTRRAQNMRVSQFQHILTEIRPYTEYIYLHVLGEPLSHPDIDAFLDAAIPMGFQVNITTNGTRLKQCYPMLSQYAIRQINVSLHSFPEHQQKGYLEDVFMACEVLAAKGIYINYRLWSLRQNDIDKNSAALLQAISQHYQLSLRQEQIHRLQRIPLKDHISLHFEEVFTWPSRTHPYVNDVGRCLGMKDMCGILVNGDVVPCCLDSKGDCVLGNIYTTSFSKIINSSRALKMVEGFAQQHICEDLCQHCSYRLRFSKDKEKANGLVTTRT